MITIIPKLIWHQGANNNYSWSIMFDDKINNTLQLRMILNNKISVLEKEFNIFGWLIFFNFFGNSKKKLINT